MTYGLKLPPSNNTSLVVPDGLAAQQWEAHLLEASLAEDGKVWGTPRLSTYRNWVGDLWSNSSHTDATAVPITHSQSGALWRRTIAESPEGPELIGHDGPASLAAQTWRSLLAWDIDPAALRAEPGQADFATFLRWCSAYVDRLRDSRFLDDAETERALLDAEFELQDPIVLLDHHDPSPVQQKLVQRLRKGGCDVRHEQAPHELAECRRIELGNEREELECAAAWARRYLESSPKRRVALVVADLDTRPDSVERSLTRAFGSGADDGAGSGIPVAIACGRPLRTVAAIDAAFCGIELLSPRGTSVTLSRWLRSGHFHARDRALRCEGALLETRLRSLLVMQVGFPDAYRHGGLAQTMRRQVPELAERLDAALAEVGAGTRLTPTAWINVWQHSLARLGWTDAASEEAAQAWDRALAEFAQLTPVLGAIPLGAALDELERILDRPQPAAPLPVWGVHVFGNIDDIGPGYDRAWITGVSDSRWPEPARDNPLLPRRLQLEHGMPASDPLAALARSRQSFERLRTRVGEVVFSWPRLEQDRQCAPSALIEDIGSVTLDGLAVTRNRERSPSTSRTLEQIADPAPPLSGSTIVGGAQTLNHQAKCPMRAFCKGRLGARPLEPFGRGLSAGMQGKLAHRAAELLFAQAGTPDALHSRLGACVERALDETFRGARGSLRALHELERDRLTTLLGKLVEAESRRDAYSVEHLEQRRRIRVDSWLVRARIDRVDRLADGTLAVLDYKTGRYAGRLEWFGDRLRDTQLPLYALELGERVSAAVIVGLREPQVSYRGIWLDPDAFPGRSQKLPDERSWHEQISVWRDQLAVLAREYAGGDTRVFESDLEAVKGSYAPLSRIYELLATWQNHT